jgi:predicted small integral membrane protein
METLILVLGAVVALVGLFCLLVPQAVLRIRRQPARGQQTTTGSTRYFRILGAVLTFCGLVFVLGAIKHM